MTPRKLPATKAECLMTLWDSPELDLDQTELPARFERLSAMGEFEGSPAYLLDVPESIKALGYGSHQFFRYYGKFPSVVGREILLAHATPGRPVVDIFSGSGTTQVEAQIQGYSSLGLDINPLAVLASNVKTGYYDHGELAAEAAAALETASRSQHAVPDLGVRAGFLDKWFTSEAQTELAQLRAAILSRDPGPTRDFLTVCFLAIVRRCSNAFDGEIRPHINSAKRPRSPLAAFRDKFGDMLRGLAELDAMRPAGIASLTGIGDNRLAANYSQVGATDVGLAISHPPYLNSFNYLAVFNLEFAWSTGFENVWGPWDKQAVGQLEQRAHPATDPKLVASYYANLHDAHRCAAEALAPGGRLAVVVGDATIRGVLEPVHLRVWRDLVDQGLEPHSAWFRTTHYGIGKYAYRHRADYHGDAEKKDAILFFSKPEN